MNPLSILLVAITLSSELSFLAVAAPAPQQSMAPIASSEESSQLPSNQDPGNHESSSGSSREAPISLPEWMALTSLAGAGGAIAGHSNALATESTKSLVPKPGEPLLDENDIDGLTFLLCLKISKDEVSLPLFSPISPHDRFTPRFFPRQD